MEDFIKKNCEICGKEFSVSKFNPYINHCKTCRKALKKEREEQKVLEKVSIPLDKFYTCETCGKSFNIDYRKCKRNTLPRFCSRECANRRNFSQESKNKTAYAAIKNFLKKKDIDFNENSDLETLKRLRDKNQKSYRYPRKCILGKFERSLPYTSKSKILRNLGFDFEKDWEDEFFRIRNLLYNLYYKEQLSFSQIREKFNIKSNVSSVHSYFNLFGLLKVRSLSEEIRLRFLKGDIILNTPDKSFFIHGWYYSKINQESFYYRSSYELQLMKILDLHKIRYDCNHFKITYFDSRLNTIRTGFPDFFLPDYNLVIETKGRIFYDEVNLSDRFEVLRKLGYGFIVVELEDSKFRVVKNFNNDEERISQLMKLIGISEE